MWDISGESGIVYTCPKCAIYCNIPYWEFLTETAILDSGGYVNCDVCGTPMIPELPEYLGEDINCN